MVNYFAQLPSLLWWVIISLSVLGAIGSLVWAIKCLSAWLSAHRKPTPPPVELIHIRRYKKPDLKKHKHPA